jgi:hypothetical protein
MFDITVKGKPLYSAVLYVEDMPTLWDESFMVFAISCPVDLPIGDCFDEYNARLFSRSRYRQRCLLYFRQQ